MVASGSVMDGDSLLVNCEDLESHLIYSCKQLILQRITFVPASSPDKYLETLKAKYKPINITKKKRKKSKKAKMLPTTKQEDTDSASSPKDEEESIFSPKVTLFNKDELALTWNSVRGIGPGLVNLGNTCFLNSVIQCLTYTPPLANYLLSGEHKKKCHQSGSCALCQLQDHVIRVLGTSGGSVRPAPIIQHLKTLTKPFRIGRQEDAHEFLRYYVDSMQKSCLKGYPSKLDPHSKSTTLVHQLFGGYFRSQVKCLKCWNTSDTYDPLLDISVEAKNCPTLSKALKKITKPDMLDGDNKYSCPKCKTLTVAQKKFTLHSLPTVLTIQLKRFNYNNYYGTKISKHVSYPEYIDLRPFMSETQGAEEWYHLYAVLVHSGVSCHSGHYYCFVVASNGAWYCMNDTHVTQVRLDTVLSQEAYLLFYVKDTNYRQSSTSYTCTMVTEPSDSSQDIKTPSDKVTTSKQLGSSGVSSSTSIANELKSHNNNANRLKRIPKLIIRKKPLNKMVQTNDQDMVDSSNSASMPKSSNASKLFTPRSVYSHPTLHNATSDSKNIESISRKDSSPLSPPHVVKSYFMPTNSKDASVQVGEPPLHSEQTKRQVAKVPPFPVSSPAAKPVARVSPQPQNISPPVHQTPVVNAVEEKAKVKDKIEVKSPEVEQKIPPRSPLPISSAFTPTIATTTVTPPIHSTAKTTAVVATTTSSTTLKTSPTTKNFPPESCSPQLPTSSDIPLASEQANTNSSVTVSDTAATTTDGEMMTMKKKKKKKKKKHHSTAEQSGQEDGIDVEHKKKKKKKRKEHKENDTSDEPKKKKKKKVKQEGDNNVGTWVEKEATPVESLANNLPLKSSPPLSPTISTPLSHDLPDKADKVIKENIKQKPTTPLPSKCEPSLPRDTPADNSKNIEEAKVEIENKLRPFLLSYFSSGGSDCSSPTAEERELDDVHNNTITTFSTTTTSDDVFAKEQATKVTPTVSTAKADSERDTGESVAASQWLGTSPILANIQSKEITADHQQKKSSGGRNSTPAHQRDNLASKVQAHSVRVNNSATSKRDNKVDGLGNKQCSHQQNSGYARQDDSSERQKSKKTHVSSISDVYINQKSSINTSYLENTTESINRKKSQRNGSSSSNNSESKDQQEHPCTKGSSSKDVSRRGSSSDYSDDTFSQQETVKKERHDGGSSSGLQQQQLQSRRERYSSSCSRQQDSRKDSKQDYRRDGSSSGKDSGSSLDRQSTKQDGNHSSSRWDRQESNEVVKELTGHHQHELGDKVRSWSGQANTVDSSVAMGSKRHRDDWDREYDTGHVKKVRRHTMDDSFSSTQNPFQEYQSKKHHNRRDNYNRYNKYEHHSGYRWRQQPYDTSYRRRSDADNRNYHRH